MNSRMLVCYLQRHCVELVQSSFEDDNACGSWSNVLDLTWILMVRIKFPDYVCQRVVLKMRK